MNDDITPTLFSEKENEGHRDIEKNTKERIGRLDSDKALRDKVLPLCRLKNGGIWEDPKGLHKIGVLDATAAADTEKIFGNERAALVINDPPYNVVVGNANTDSLFKIDRNNYLEFSAKWVENAEHIMRENSHFYVWLGADYKDGFQPLPDFMIMMRGFDGLTPRNFITLRNQRGYGTQKNWMWVRQELLHYIKGSPDFKVVYTDIPKVLKGYYKVINNKLTENIDRKSVV